MTPIRQRERLLLPAGERSFVLPRRTRSPLLTCPGCHVPAGHLYYDADTPAGACLSCKIDADVIDAREAESDAAFWAEAQLRETTLLEEDGLTREEWHAELWSEYQRAAF